MLNRKTFFIREHVGFMKLSDTYDILDPETKTQLGIAKEKPGTLIHLLRLLVSKRLLPTKVFVYEGTNPEDESKLLFSIQRGGFALFKANINICDGRGNTVGCLKSKFFSLGGFHVYDALGNQFSHLKGDWKGWNFRFMDMTENEIGTITKKWAGVGQELFTSADNYIISLSQKPNAEKAMLLLAAGLAVDTVYKEN